MNKEISTEVSSDRFRVSAFVRMRDNIANAQSRKNLSKPWQRRNSLKKTMLIRYHPHLERAYVNDKISRQRSIPVGATTFLILSGCFLSGYAYSRLKRDEFLRRTCYQRYYNSMSAFDAYSDRLESWLDRCYTFLTTFDTAKSWWKFKKMKYAEFRQRY